MCFLVCLAEFLLEELKSLCEYSARKIVSVANVAKMLLAAERYQGETLKAACLAYVQKNIAEVWALGGVYRCVRPWEETSLAIVLSFTPVLRRQECVRLARHIPAREGA